MSTELMIIYGSLISCLVAIVAYFLNRWVTAIDKLIEVVADLNTIVALIQTNQNNAALNCQFKHNIIDSRFNSHSEKLHEFGIDITNLKIEASKNK